MTDQALIDEAARRLDRVPAPQTRGGAYTPRRLRGLPAGGGKVALTIEAPAEAVESYRAVRDAAEAAVRAAPEVKSVTAVLTAHEAKGGGLSDVRAVIAVASAKGGVGKSTVAV